ncbi:hypothetical protein [Candidatus Pelagibacter sp. HIMB1587]|uniref:hypothetical protein n=1 Tax=Candidatus Pelagibacter sp. HIMB1587 TaxID=3413354 RepID=UPI003F834857
MQRFQYLKGLKDDEKFKGMSEMTDHIKFQKNNSSKMFSPIEDIMDLFYLSLLVGLKKNKKIDFNDTKYIKGDMVPNWTDNLSVSKDLLVALFVSHMINEKDKNYENKPEIQKILNEKLGKNPVRSISDEGMIDLHCYAFGGYFEIMKKLDNKLPSDLLMFFSTINKLVTDD